ncbi:hypothetical protein ELY21_15360 [Legionella sp. km535]|uniref:hypothetical protein n=1 Tax=Legionella sp. km535 TaxID=2498107 RepID=UPI000F8E52C1|nr:hypothetical protein [Legionella sp. km535]RUR14759.1 hypothetical protein ELY21_15360 [Legionella sp. km535]
MQKKNDTTLCSQNDLATLIKDTKIQERQREILLKSIKKWHKDRGFYDRWLWIGTNHGNPPEK